LNRPALALALALAAVPAAALARGPSTPAERKRAVETTRQLEKDPLAPGAMAARKWLLTWIEEIPDITVRTCSGPLDALAQDRGGERYGRILFAQASFGIVSWLIEHPKAGGDWIAEQTAGLESVLRAYRSILRREPQARWEELDLLLEAKRQGKLSDVVEQTMETCGEEGGDGSI
jgi:hypothetical protein